MLGSRETDLDTREPRCRAGARWRAAGGKESGAGPKSRRRGARPQMCARRSGDAPEAEDPGPSSLARHDGVETCLQWRIEATGLLPWRDEQWSGDASAAGHRARWCRAPPLPLLCFSCPVCLELGPTSIWRQGSSSGLDLCGRRGPPWRSVEQGSDGARPWPYPIWREPTTASVCTRGWACLLEVHLAHLLSFPKGGLYAHANRRNC
jgi:hypothetical protein